MSGSRITAYYNGGFLPLDAVRISPLDRGFLFADGVYEVIPVYNGHFLCLAKHLARLENGLVALKLDAGLDRAGWNSMLRELVERNGSGQLAVYLQVTRGAPAVRDHNFPQPTARPTVFAMANPLKPNPALQTGWSAYTTEDIRWGACHLKTIALLANVLARQQAIEQGGDDVILVRDGLVTECAAGNVYVIQNGVIRTPLKDHRILPGITRDLILELAAADGIPYREQDVPATTLASADEVWVSSSTKEVVPIIRVDDRAIGTGAPGPLWQRVFDLYQDHKNQVCPPMAQTGTGS